LPGGLESGRYRWQLSVNEWAESGSREWGSAAELGGLEIDAPERIWEAPAVELALEVELGEKVGLLGASVEPVGVLTSGIDAGEEMTVTLVWQGREEMETSYRVFLHLLGPDGELLVQSDGEPAGWTRPTTGWAAGEVVLDQRVLSIPGDAAAGEYSLVTGLYDLGTAERLSLPDGATAVLISPIAILEP
jgi:hypothetical protein